MTDIIEMINKKTTLLIAGRLELNRDKEGLVLCVLQSIVFLTTRVK